MNLTDAQRRLIESLEAETGAKLETILTSEQSDILSKPCPRDAIDLSQSVSETMFRSPVFFSETSSPRAAT